MKRQINNLVYDTDRAEKLCEHANTFSRETLYKTPKGRFFKFKSSPLDLSSDDIVTLTPLAASEFFVAHGEMKDYERVFGTKIEEA